MEKISLAELEKIFGEHNQIYDRNMDKNPLHAVIVYKASNFPGHDYPVESLSYETYSNSWGWDWSKMGHARYGYCLDGTDPGVRLDWYDWDVDYCYLLDN